MFISRDSYKSTFFTCHVPFHLYTLLFFARATRASVPICVISISCVIIFLNFLARANVPHVPDDMITNT